MVIVPCDIGILCSVPVVVPGGHNIFGLVKEKHEEKVIPDDLVKYKDLIKTFWKGKKGAKTNQAFKMQITEFRKFITKYGEKVLIAQLEACLLYTSPSPRDS